MASSRNFRLGRSRPASTEWPPFDGFRRFNADMNNPFSKQDLVRVVAELPAHVLSENPERIESRTRMVDESGVESLDVVELRSLL